MWKLAIVVAAVAACTPAYTPVKRAVAVREQFTQDAVQVASATNTLEMRLSRKFPFGTANEGFIWTLLR